MGYGPRIYDFYYMRPLAHIREKRGYKQYQLQARKACFVPILRTLMESIDHHKRGITMKKLLIALFILTALLMTALAEQVNIDFSTMNLEELLTLQAEVSKAIAEKRTETSNIDIDASGKTLRDIFPCLDLAKAIRDEIGLVSIDQPIPDGKLKEVTIIDHLIYPDAKTVNITSVEGIQYLTELQSVQLHRMFYPHYDKITSLPDGFYSLKKVWQLCLGSTSITEIDPRIGNMTSIQELYLDGMEIDSLPEELGNLYQLETLDLSDSTITSLPNSFSNLTALTTLNLSGTQISEFPLCILSMSNLQSLDLSNTQIDELPPEIAKMSNLRELDISNTKISSLPQEMYSMALETFKKDGLNIE